MENERIELLSPNSKKGTFMLKQQYELVCEFLFQSLEAKQKITLTELLATTERSLSKQFSGNLFLAVLQVKLDLQARGLITISMEKGRIQVIELKKSAWKKLSMAGGLGILKEGAEQVTPITGIKMWHLNY